MLKGFLKEFQITEAGYVVCKKFKTSEMTHRSFMVFRHNTCREKSQGATTLLLLQKHVNPED